MKKLDRFSIDFTIEDSGYCGKYYQCLRFDDWKDSKRDILEQAKEILIKLFNEKDLQKEYYVWQVYEKLTKRGKILSNHWQIYGKIFKVDIFVSTVWHGEYSLRRFLPYKASFHNIKLVDLSNYVLDEEYLYKNKPFIYKTKN